MDDDRSVRGRISTASQKLFEKKSAARSNALVEMQSLLSTACPEDIDGLTSTLCEGLLRCVGKGADEKERVPASNSLCYLLFLSPEAAGEVLSGMKKGLDAIFLAKSCVAKTSLCSLYTVTCLALQCTGSELDHEHVLNTLLNSLFHKISAFKDLSSSAPPAISGKDDAEIGALLDSINGCLISIGESRVAGFLLYAMNPILFNLCLSGSGNAQRSAMNLLQTILSACAECTSNGLPVDATVLPHFSHSFEPINMDQLLPKLQNFSQQIESMVKFHTASGKKTEKSSLNKDLNCLLDVVDTLVSSIEDPSLEIEELSEPIQTGSHTQELRGALPLGMVRTLRVILGTHWLHFLKTNEFLAALLGVEQMGGDRSMQGGSGLSRAAKIARSRAFEKSNANHLKKMRDMKSQRMEL